MTVDDVVEIESESSYYPQNPFDSLSLSLSLTPDMENGIDCIPKPRASVVEKSLTWKDYEFEIPKPYKATTPNNKKRGRRSVYL